MIKFIFLFFLIHYVSICYTQVDVIVCQKCFSKDIFIGGHETLIGTPMSDSCTKFTFNIEEPEYLFFAFGPTAVHRERLWIDPRFKRRRIQIDNCTNTMVQFDTIPIELDDAECNKYEQDLIQSGVSEDSLIHVLRNCEETYLLSHPDSFLALQYLQMTMADFSLNKVKEYYNLVKKNNSQYPILKDIELYIKNYKYRSTSKKGDFLFEFDAQTPTSKHINSKSINGKVIVLFFWYSGCGPCHKVIPLLNQIYVKYHHLGLELINFSLDKELNIWKKSITDLNPKGINVSDLMGSNSPQVLHYGVSAFPFFVIFDKERKINTVTFGSEEVPLVESKIKEILNLE